MSEALGRGVRGWARASACTLALSVGACTGAGDGDDDASGAGTSGAMSGGAQSGASAAGTTSAGSTAVDNAASAGTTAGPGDAGASTLELPPPLPPCAEAPSAGDAGVSPYDGTCVDESVGVFASPSGDVAPRADGSRSRPFRSLQDAVGLAVREGRDVYACAGTYEDAVQIGTELSNGLALYGGLSCDGFSGPDASGARSVVHAVGATAALRIDACSGVTVERFELHADRDAMPKPGSSYIALSLTSALDVELRDVVLRAADGEPGGDVETPAGAAADGADGGDGKDACSVNPNPGGAGALAGTCEIPQPWVNGGAGGVAGLGTGPGGPGFQQTFPATLGEPEGASGTWSCTPGQGSGPMASAVGSPGNVGRGGRGFGALLSGRFVGYGGRAGFDAPPGSGGMGGGGARAPSSCAGLGSAVGASGGGGGSGGCGGLGGSGGGAGGSSIGLLALDSEVMWFSGELHVGHGGAGGDGADGQPGGAGGEGGKGGQGVSGSSDACDGTDGSPGGPGGAGGGGNGGHALGVLYDGDEPVLEGVTAAIEGATDWGGAPGVGPEGLDPVFVEQLVGTPGVTARVQKF